MVFAADLEEVEEVGRRGMDSDQVLVRLGIGRGKIDDREVFGPLLEFSMVRIVIRVVHTWTYSFSWIAFIMDQPVTKP